MPPKYSQVKKRPPLKPKKTSATSPNNHGKPNHRVPAEQALSPPLPPQSPNAKLEHTISRIMLARYEQDAARLYSAHLFTAALVHIPTFVLRCAAAAGPGWAAVNADSDAVKDFLRAIVGMELRQTGERVATKSILWSYTALRHFATSNGVNICAHRGLRSADLLPHFDALRAYLDTLERMPAPTFARPPSLGPLSEALVTLDEACESRFGSPPRVRQHFEASRRACEHCGAAHGSQTVAENIHPLDCALDKLSADSALNKEEEEWKFKVRVGYERTCQVLWRIAGEFDVRGYGLVLKDKLEHKWCPCGCSTDHLSEVCERTIRDEEDAQVRKRADGAAKRTGKGKEIAECTRPMAVLAHETGLKGKEREWDGRGCGVHGWGTEEEEDVWEMGLNFTHGMPDDKHTYPNGSGAPQQQRAVYTGQQPGDPSDQGMTIGQLMEWRYFKAEREKEAGNAAFKAGAYGVAITHYERAQNIEPEMPYYQLNIAAACLKLSRWVEAEAACSKALAQHRSSKGYFRRARARNMMGKQEDAIKDLRAALELQPSNIEALEELNTLLAIQSQAPFLTIKSHSATSAAADATIPAGSSSHNGMSPSYHHRNGDVPSCSSKPTNRDLRGLPFEPTSADNRKLQFTFAPILVEMAPLHDDDGGQSHPVRREKRTFVCPAWDRYTVKRVWT